MKKTILSTILISGMTIASAADVTSVELTGGSTTVASGTTFGALTLQKEMTTGNVSSAADLNTELNSTVNITGGNFYAGDYTISLWLTTEQLTSDKILFAYCGKVNTGYNLGYNGFTWNAEQKTITVGRGTYSATDNTFTYNESDKVTSNALTITTEDELLNLTFAVAGSSGSQTVTIWMNGQEIETLSSYAGNMNDGNASTRMNLLFDTATTYGDIAITNEKLTTSSQIASLAVVPEPTSASLSLLALSALAIRRRR